MVVGVHGAGMNGAIITATVTTPVVTAAPQGRVHTDSVLAYAATLGIEETLPPVSSQTVPIEIQGLDVLWRSPDGWPLWACTDLYPVGEVSEAREYAHKRFASHRAAFGSKPGVSTVAGMFKEQRRVLRTFSAGQWRAALICHDLQLVQELLQRVRHIGGRTAAGFGRVAAWDVQPADVDVDWLLSRRCVPASAGLRTDGPVAPALGWTPPYWHAALWEPALDASPCF